MEPRKLAVYVETDETDQSGLLLRHGRHRGLRGAGRRLILWSEMRKLVDDETGADAAMSILGEALARANRVLDRLAMLVTGPGAAATAAAA
jgi:hypothetical protein